MGVLAQLAGEDLIREKLREAEEKKRNAEVYVRERVDQALLSFWPERDIEDLRREHADIVTDSEAILLKYRVADAEAEMKFLRGLLEP